MPFVINPAQCRMGGCEFIHHSTGSLSSDVGLEISQFYFNQNIRENSILASVANHPIIVYMHPHCMVEFSRFQHMYFRFIQRKHSENHHEFSSQHHSLCAWAPTLSNNNQPCDFVYRIVVILVLLLQVSPLLFLT